KKAIRQFTHLFVVIASSAILTAHACTSFIVKSNDDGYVYGRTLEFGINLESQPTLIPRHFDYQGTGVDGQLGNRWTTKYAAIGMNGIGLPILVDGLNEKGMTGGLLYAPNTAVFQQVSVADSKKSIASYEL